MSKVSEIPREVQQNVIEEFLKTTGFKDVAEKEESITFTSPFTLGRDEEDLAYGTSGKAKPLGLLKNIDPYHLLSIIRREHPQTIALILKYLQRDKASLILSELPTVLQADVSRRLTEMGKISPDILSEIEKVLEDRLYSLMEGEFVEIDGPDALVEILSEADKEVEEKIISGLSERAPQVVDGIRTKLCDFEDMAYIDDESLRQVLRLTDLRDLTVALKGAPGGIAERIYSLLPQDTTQALKEDIEALGQISLEEIRSAQQQIRNILRGLATLGKIRFK